jgi:hypothetical protein
LVSEKNSYEMLYGRFPFQETDTETLLKQKTTFMLVPNTDTAMGSFEILRAMIDPNPYTRIELADLKSQLEVLMTKNDIRDWTKVESLLTQIEIRKDVFLEEKKWGIQRNDVDLVAGASVDKKIEFLSSKALYFIFLYHKLVGQGQMEIEAQTKNLFYFFLCQKISYTFRDILSLMNGSGGNSRYYNARYQVGNYNDSSKQQYDWENSSAQYGRNLGSLATTKFCDKTSVNFNWS